MSAAREYADRAHPPIPEGEPHALYVCNPSRDADLDALAEVIADLLPDGPPDEPERHAA